MYEKYIKRILDIIFALILLPLFCILFIITAPIIYFEDKGPIFYNAKRIGQKGKLFKMYKFRSMKVDAPDIRLEDGSTYNSPNDPRVTKIGKYIRETSIDEIPQILNVLIGNMSFIGPRPDPPDWLERYSDEIKVFLKVKPGISGYSQAYFRNSVSSQEKMRNDVHYTENISFILDVKILLKTVCSVIKRENMYRSNGLLERKNGSDM